MGLLTLFNKVPGPLLRLSSGSFTVDREGGVLITTLPSTFPGELIAEIAVDFSVVWLGAACVAAPGQVLGFLPSARRVFARPSELP